MRMALWTALALALAAALDDAVYNGRHAQAVAQVARHMTTHFR
jgi:hypothetical protein